MFSRYHRPGYYHMLGQDFAWSNGGGYFGGDAAVGSAIADTIFSPQQAGWTITKAGVYNADTTSDTTLSTRVGLYTIETDGTLALVYEFGTIGKDTTATTTVRQVGSDTSIALTANKMYATVTLIEALRGSPGTTLGFASNTRTTYFGNVWGAVGDNSTNDFTWRGTDSGYQPGWKSLSTGSMPATLPIPTMIVVRNAAVFYYLSAE